MFILRMLDLGLLSLELYFVGVFWETKKEHNKESQSKYWTSNFLFTYLHKNTRNIEDEGYCMVGHLTNDNSDTYFLELWKQTHILLWKQS